MQGAGLTNGPCAKALSDRPAFQPYWGKPAVRNDRGDGGNVGIIRSPLRATVLPDRKAARENKEMKFIALLHHLTVDPALPGQPGQDSSATSAPAARSTTGKRTSRAQEQKHTNVSFIRPPGHSRRSRASESHTCSAMCKYIELSRNWTPRTDIVLLGNTG
jgi:hypothetical protein